jgi:hypothetical protein
LKSSARADLALVNAGALNRGTLAEGDINADAIATLLAFPDDEVVTLTITGAQLRAALERAVQAYPTGSSAWLHGAGFHGGVQHAGLHQSAHHHGARARSRSAGRRFVFRGDADQPG